MGCDNDKLPVELDDGGVKERVGFDTPKAVKLRYNQGLSYAQIAKLMDCSKSTVGAALRPFERLMKHNGDVKAFVQNHSTILEGVLMEFVSAMQDPAKLKSATLNNLSYSYDRIFNALRLLQDKSTVNVAHAVDHAATIAEIDAEIAALTDQSVDCVPSGTYNGVTGKDDSAPGSTGGNDPPLVLNSTTQPTDSTRAATHPKPNSKAAVANSTLYIADIEARLSELQDIEDCKE